MVNGCEGSRTSLVGGSETVNAKVTDLNAKPPAPESLAFSSICDMALC
jgi:hypothetical protein